MVMSRPPLPWGTMLLLLTLTLTVSSLQASQQGDSVTTMAKTSTTSDYASDGGLGLLGSLWASVNPYLSHNATEPVLSLKTRLQAGAGELLARYTSAASFVAADTLPLRTKRDVVMPMQVIERVAREGREAPEARMKPRVRALKDSGVSVVTGVDGVSWSVGAEAGQGIRLAVWHGRLIMVLVGAEDVTLAAVHPTTYQTERTAGVSGRGSCDVHLAPHDRLLLVCLSPTPPVPSKLGGPPPGATEVAVYLVREPARGVGPLALEFVHTVAAYNPTHLHMWTQEGETWLIVTEGAAPAENTTGLHMDGMTFHTESLLYRWTGLYFDKAGQLPAASPHHAHHFLANRYHFVALASFINNLGQHNTECHIFRYEGSGHQGRYALFQTLPTRGARHFQAFTLAAHATVPGTQKPHEESHTTFLAVANFCEDNIEAACDPLTMSAIFRYYLGKFILFQEIPTKHAIQWLAIQTESTVVLALASESEGVVLYQYTGWRFSRTPAQPKAQPFSPRVTSLHTIHWSGMVLIGVSNGEQENSAGHPSLYTLSFTRDTSLQQFYVRAEGVCQSLLRRMAEQDVAGLRRRLEGGADQVITGPRTFTSPVMIRGNLEVHGESRVTKVFRRWAGEVFPGRLERMEQVWENVGEEAKRVEARLANTIPTDRPTSWPPGLHFSNLVSVASRNASFVNDLKTTFANGRQVPPATQLVDLASNITLPSARFTHVVAMSGVAARRLRGRPLSSYVKLSGRHTLTGTITFLGRVVAGRVVVASTIDSTLIHPGSILLTSPSPQTHTGRVDCAGLLTVDGDLAVNTVNNVNINRLLQNLVLSGAPANITGPLRISGDLVYKDNLQMTVAPDLDVVNPLRTDLATVQVITAGKACSKLNKIFRWQEVPWLGDHRLSGVAWENIVVGGTVNSVEVPGHLFINEGGRTYTVQAASFTRLIADSLAITNSMNSISVSEGQLDMLRYEGKQVITAKKTFTAIYLLHQKQYSPPGRLRRGSSDSSELCDQTEVGNVTGSSVLLQTLRSVAAARDMLDLLSDFVPSNVTLSKTQVKFFTRLLEDVRCAFIMLNPEDGFLFYEFYLMNWRDIDTTTTTELDLREEDLTALMTNLENFISNTTKQLSDYPVVWQDVFTIFRDATRAVADFSSSSEILNSLKMLFESSAARSGEIAQNCSAVCSDTNTDETEVNSQRESTYTSAGERFDCSMVLNLVRGVVKRIASYQTLLREVEGEVSERLLKLLGSAAVEHDLGRLLVLVKEEEGLQRDLNAALRCGVWSGWSNEETLQMLLDYEQELRRMAKFSTNDGAISDKTQIHRSKDDQTTQFESGSDPYSTTVKSTTDYGKTTDDWETSLQLTTVTASDSVEGVEDVTKAIAGSSLLSLEQDNDSASHRQTRQTPEPTEEIESFISELQGYIGDIKSEGDLQTLISKWNETELVTMFDNIDRIFQENPSLVTPQVKLRIIEANEVLDEVKETLADVITKLDSRTKLQLSEESPLPTTPLELNRTDISTTNSVPDHLERTNDSELVRSGGVVESVHMGLIKEKILAEVKAEKPTVSTERRVKNSENLPMDHLTKFSPVSMMEEANKEFAFQEFPLEVGNITENPYMVGVMENQVEERTREEKMTISTSESSTPLTSVPVEYSGTTLPSEGVQASESSKITVDTDPEELSSKDFDSDWLSRAIGEKFSKLFSNAWMSLTGTGDSRQEDSRTKPEAQKMKRSYESKEETQDVNKKYLPLESNRPSRFLKTVKRSLFDNRMPLVSSMKDYSTASALESDRKYLDTLTNVEQGMSDSVTDLVIKTQDWIAKDLSEQLVTRVENSGGRSADSQKSMMVETSRLPLSIRTVMITKVNCTDCSFIVPEITSYVVSTSNFAIATSAVVEEARYFSEENEVTTDSELGNEGLHRSVYIITSPPSLVSDKDDSDEVKADDSNLGQNSGNFKELKKLSTDNENTATVMEHDTEVLVRKKRESDENNISISSNVLSNLLSVVSVVKWTTITPTPTHPKVIRTAEVEGKNLITRYTVERCPESSEPQMGRIDTNLVIGFTPVAKSVAEVTPCSTNVKVDSDGNYIRELHYTTVTTQLQQLYAHIDCTSCIFIYTSMGTEEIADAMLSARTASPQYPVTDIKTGYERTLTVTTTPCVTTRTHYYTKPKTGTTLSASHLGVYSEPSASTHQTPIPFPFVHYPGKRQVTNPMTHYQSLKSSALTHAPPVILGKIENRGTSTSFLPPIHSSSISYLASSGDTYVWVPELSSSTTYSEAPASISILSDIYSMLSKVAFSNISALSATASKPPYISTVLPGSLVHNPSPSYISSLHPFTYPSVTHPSPLSTIRPRTFPPLVTRTIQVFTQNSVSYYSPNTRKSFPSSVLFSPSTRGSTSPVSPHASTISFSGIPACRDVPPRYWQDQKYILSLLPRLRLAAEFLQKMQKTRQWVLVKGPGETSPLAESLLYISKEANQTIVGLYKATMQTAETLHPRSLEKQVEDMIVVVKMGAKSQRVFSNEFVEKMRQMRMLALEAHRKVTEAWQCLNATYHLLSPSYYTISPINIYSITRGYDVSPEEILPPKRTYTTTTSPGMKPRYGETTPLTPPPRPPPPPPPGSGLWLPYGSWVVGLVSGYRLEDLVHATSPQLPPPHLAIHFIATHTARVQNIRFEGGVSVERVGGVDVNRLVRHGVQLSSPTLNTSITFTTTVRVDGDVTAVNINGVPAAAYLTLTGTHTLPRLTTFTGLVTVRGNVLVRSTTNQLNLSTFISSVMTTVSTASQVLTTPITFVSLAVPRLESGSVLVAGVNLSDLVLRDQNAVITGRKRFVSVRVREGGVRMGKLNLHRINNMDLDALFKHSLRKNSDVVQVLQGEVQLSDLVILGNLTTTRGITLPILPPDSTIPNTINLVNIMKRVVWRDRTTTITGGLVLNGAVSVTSLTFRGTFDGVSAVRYEHEWLLRTTTQTFTHAVTFSTLSTGAANVTPGTLVQGVDIAAILLIAVTTDVPATITSPIVFNGRVWAARVDVQGKVQGWKLSQQAILVNSTNTVITAAKTFLSSVHIIRTLTSRDLPSGTDFAKLCGQMNRMNLTTFGSVSFTGGVSVDVVHIGRHALTEGAIGNFWLLDKDVVLRNTFTFEEVFVASHITAQTVNNVNLADVWARALRKNCGGGGGSDRQLVTGSFTIRELMVNSLVTSRLTTTILNGRGTSELSFIFTVDGEQLITGHWRVATVVVEGSVVLASGRVSGMRVADWCRRGQSCRVIAAKTFAKDLIVLGDLNVHPNRLVQGVDVSEALRDVVTTNDCGTIPGVTTFASTLKISSLGVRGLVDGVNMTTSRVLTLSGAQVITAAHTISYVQGPAVTAPSITAVDGLFNGLDFTLNITRRMFHLDQTLVTVTAPVKFTGRVNFTDGRIETPDRPGLPSQDVQGALKALPPLSIFIPRFLTLQTLANSTRSAIIDSGREAWGWRRMQDFPASTLRLVPLASSCSPPIALLPHQGEARILTYNPAQQTYIDSGTVLGGSCVVWATGWSAEGQFFVATSHSCSLHTPSVNTSSTYFDTKDEMVQIFRLIPQLQLLQRIPMPAVSDIKVVVLRGRVCLVVGAGGRPDTPVLCQLPGSFTFVQQQTLDTGSPIKVSVVQQHEVTVVAVVGSGNNTEGEAITVWTLDAEQDKLVLLKRECVKGAVWADLAANGPDLLLAVLVKAFRGDQEATITIYRLEWQSVGHPVTASGIPGYDWRGDRLEAPSSISRLVLVEEQELEVAQAVEVHFSSFTTRLASDRLYLFVSTLHGDLVWFTHRGIHRFWREGSMHNPGKQAASVWRGCDGGVWVAVTSGDPCLDAPLSASPPEPALILQARYRPPRPQVTVIGG